MRGELLRNHFRPGLDALIPLTPVGATHLATLLRELQGIDDAKRLVPAPVEGKIVDDLMLYDPALVDRVRGAQGDALRVFDPVRLSGGAEPEILLNRCLDIA